MISRRHFIKGIGTLALSLCLPPRFAIEAAAKVIPAPEAVVANAFSHELMQAAYDQMLRQYYMPEIHDYIFAPAPIFKEMQRLLRKNSNNELLEDGKRIITPIHYAKED